MSSSDHSVLVPDTELLFTAQFHRAGPDLVLTGRDGQHHLIPGYFSSEQHPALVAPNGAHLSPDTVDLLAGSATPGHYAQAQPTASPDSIGKIEKVVGDVTVMRNGVAVALHVGDAVFKSDVVQTGASSSCGISFPDGTALNLVANTRMALNDYAYDANSNGNGALFTLVEGTFAFVAGKVAHQGDMKIATPVATMGIRGTTGVVQQQPDTPATITAQAGSHTYTFAVVPDFGTGVTGMWDVFLTDANGVIQRDANGNPIVLVTVSQSGYVTFLTPQGFGQPPLVSTEPVTNAQYAFEQDLLQQLFQTLNPNAQNNNGNNGSSTPPPQFELLNPIPQLLENGDTKINFNDPSDNLRGNTGTTPADVILSSGPLTVVIWIAGGNGSWSTGPFWLGGSPPTSPQEVEILNPVKVTTDGVDSAAGLVLATGAILNIVSGTSFTIYDFIHGGGTVAINSSGSDPTLFIHGDVILTGGGTIKMLGPTGEDYILGTPGTGAALINVDYTIEGTGTIGGGDGNLTFENFGTVNANNGLLTVNTGNQVYNDGLMEATVGPLPATPGTLQIEDSVVNAGTVQADGIGTAVELSGATFDNLFSVVAKNGGSVFFIDVAVTNEAIRTTDPVGGAITADGGTITFDGGSVANGNVMEATDGGILQLENIIVTNSSAAQLTVDATSELVLTNADVLGGTVDNAGTVVTAGSSALEGDIVVNDGTMLITNGASLTLQDITLISDAGSGLLALNAGATLSLSDASIEGITIDGTDVVAVSTVDVTNDSTLTDVTLVNGGLTVEGDVTLSVEGNSTFDGVAVTDKGSIQIDNSEASATLIVDDNSTITGGTLSIGSAGIFDVETGAHGLPGFGATLDHVDVIDNGHIEIGATSFVAILTLDDDTNVHGGGSVTIEAHSKLDVEHGGATLGGISVIDDGTIQMDSGSILALFDDSISGSGLMRINSGSTLNADGGTTTIDLGGTILNTATIEASAGATLDVVSHVDNTSGALWAVAGGKLDIESAISGGIATIQHGTLEFDASSNVNVTFDNSGGYGLLVLGDAEHFSGQIFDFSGTAPDAGNSDEVELTNFTETSSSVQFSGGNEILTLHDANGDFVTLTFDNFGGTLSVSTSGGKTYIYDPPAAGAKDAPSTVTADPGNGHATASANQNGTDHAAGPANEAAFGSDQILGSDLGHCQWRRRCIGYQRVGAGARRPCAWRRPARRRDGRRRHSVTTRPVLLRRARPTPVR